MKRYAPDTFSVEKPIGAGRERVVYRDSNNPELAVGFFHEYAKEEPEKIKGRFYLTKIVHGLFPNATPDIHLADSRTQALVTDYIDSEPENLPIPIEIRKIRLSISDLGVLVDQAQLNFLRDKSGEVKYIETFSPWGQITVGEKRGTWFRDYDPEKILSAIEALTDPLLKHKLTNYLTRLESLFFEAQNKKHV